jgi:hypothetical protein
MAAEGTVRECGMDERRTRSARISVLMMMLAVVLFVSLGIYDAVVGH